MTTFKLIHLGAASALTQDATGTILPEMFTSERYNPA
jgi:hypothetical protein